MVLILEGNKELIELSKLNNQELQRMIDIALEFENYEMCAHLKKYLTYTL